MKSPSFDVRTCAAAFAAAAFATTMLSAILSAGALQSGPRVGHPRMDMPLRRASESDATWAVEVTTPLGDTHTLEVPERHNLLRAVERAGLLPASDCRRGNCLSCAARVLDGAPYSLQMKRDATSLCGEAHDDGVVLLCSAHAVGPGLRLQLGADGDAWEMQYRDRFDNAWEPPEPPEPPSSFMWPPA